MNIRDLAAKTGLAERQIRYLIAEGFIPAPSGGRANADYGEPHVAGIQRYMRLRELGFPPAAIKLLLDAGEGAPFVIAPGVTLVIDPVHIGTGKDTTDLVRRIDALLTELFLDGHNDKNPHARKRRQPD